VSGLEIGGLCGSLLAGKLSDARVNAASESQVTPLIKFASLSSLIRTSQGKVGLRIQIVLAYLVGVGGSLFLFWIVPDTWWMQWLVIFCIGFFLYGPQVPSLPPSLPRRVDAHCHPSLPPIHSLSRCSLASVAPN